MTRGSDARAEGPCSEATRNTANLCLGSRKKHAVIRWSAPLVLLAIWYLLCVSGSLPPSWVRKPAHCAMPYSDIECALLP